MNRTVAGFKYAHDNKVSPWTGDELRTNVSTENIRTEPANLTKQLALKQAQSGQGKVIMENKINDSNWDGWQKMQHVHKMPDGRSISIHYWRNPNTNEMTGFKFKNPIF